MILVELVNAQGKTLAAAMTETGDWEQVGTISDAEITVYRNRKHISFRIFGLGDRVDALDDEDWNAMRAADSWRATCHGAPWGRLSFEGKQRFAVLPLTGNNEFASPPGRLLIAEDHLSPDEIADAEKRWQLPFQKETR